MKTRKTILKIGNSSAFSLIWLLLLSGTSILLTIDGYIRYIRGEGIFIYTIGILEIGLLVGISILGITWYRTEKKENEKEIE